MEKSYLLDKLNSVNKNILENYQSESNTGVLNGLSGSALFLGYYDKYILKNNSSLHIEKILNLCIDRINEGDKMLTFCDGISGFAWALIFLQYNNLIDDIDEEIFDIFDEYISEWIIYCIENNNFDFLHGSAGGILYMLNRIENTKDRQKIFEPTIAKFLASLQNRYFEIEDFKNFKKRQDFKKRTYLGLAHGIAGLINILSKLSLLDSFNKDSLSLIDSYNSFLFSIIKESENKISLFPSWLTQKTDIKSAESALSWCSGDLGIGISLLNAAYIIKDQSIKDKALEILIHSSKRILYEKSLLTEPGICHGFFGVYKIFSRAYTLTRENIFLEAKEYWLKKGLVHIKHQNTHNDLSILNGQAGIGLALIDAYTKIDHEWGECLLIS